jgi:hypothetical protein
VNSCSDAGLTLQKGGPIVAMMCRDPDKDFVRMARHGKKGA